MSDEFGPNFITITDEEGNDIELEYVDALEHNGVTYVWPFSPADTEEEAESAQDFGLVILKSVMENGEELLATPDTDEELNRSLTCSLSSFWRTRNKSGIHSPVIPRERSDRGIRSFGPDPLQNIGFYRFGCGLPQPVCAPASQ